MATTQNVMITPEGHDTEEVNASVVPDEVDVGLALPERTSAIVHAKNEPNLTRLPPPPSYRLFYWPGFPGRGEFLRLLFAETNTAYEDVYAGMTFDEASAACYNNPNRFAVPAIENLDHIDPDTGKPLVLSQTAVIIQYLASRCAGGRLLPESDTRQLRAAVLMSDVVDVMEEGCKAWHALNYNGGYTEQVRREIEFRASERPKRTGI